MYDFIIVGAGISGLYCAYKYMIPNNKKYLILDKHNYIGGRALSKKFHNATVQLGAGIIEDNNKHLLDLLKKLKIKTIPLESKYKHQYKTITDEYGTNITNQIKDVYYKNKTDIKTFKYTFNQFLNIYFSPEFVLEFKNLCDYNDFFEADVEKVITEYPIEDVIAVSLKFSMIVGGWDVLLNKFLEKIPNGNIQLDKTVMEITNLNHKVNVDNKLLVKCQDEMYETKNVIFCADIEMKKIRFNGFDSRFNKKMYDILDHIRSIPFMRMFTYHDQAYDIKNNIRTMTPLNRIIPINPHVLMASYCDNDNALFFYELLKKIQHDELKIIVHNMLKNSIDDNDKITPFSDFILKYWKHGIHYYKPHNDTKLFNQDILVDNHILMCGEMISKRQGWVEGSIQSVDDVYDDVGEMMIN